MVAEMTAKRQYDAFAAEGPACSGHPGDYQLTATAAGYQSSNRWVTLLNGGFTTGDISLTQSNLTGDFNGDGLIDIIVGGNSERRRIS